MDEILTLTPGELDFKIIRKFIKKDCSVQLAESAAQAINASREVVESITQNDKSVYGINTGFGLLAKTRINAEQLKQLQHNIVVSHAAGVGDLLPDAIVRLMMLLKVNSLACGYSGVRLNVIEMLVELLNNQVYPCVPAKGSVGASGDLAPLAHMSLMLLGEGEVRFHGEVISATQALAAVGLQPIQLAEKEGLALLNGTQASTALALYHLIQIECLFNAELITGCLSLEAIQGSDIPFDPRIQVVRKHQEQLEIADTLSQLVQGSEIRHSHIECDRVQDPYSFRCQPQVMGACLMHLRHAARVLINEANGVTDNPLVFSAESEVLSGGNFHAEPVAISADLIAICLSEMGAISERRIAVLVDPALNIGLPAFLVKEAGVNSGFMIAQVTAAALASENKTYAHPASIDSLPTSANQEDHVSMATFAARRLGEMSDNVANIIAIELLAGCQGVNFRQPLKTSQLLRGYHKKLREVVPFYDQDRHLSTDIQAAKELLLGEFNSRLFINFA